MRVFGIAVTPPLYYIMSMSVAQVELMACDVAVSNFRRSEDRKDGFASPERKELEEAAEKWRRKYGDGGDASVAFDASKWKVEH